MIDTIKIELGRKEYELDIELDAAPANGYCWRESTTYLEPSAATQAELNRLFIERQLASIVDQLQAREYVPFSKIAEAMGATIEDYEEAGLESLLKVVAPNRLLERQFAKLPPAAHNPFNCAAIRDWTFGTPSTEWQPPEFVVCVGSGPFEQHEFEQFLRKHAITPIPLANYVQVATEYVHFQGECVLGRVEWDEDEVDDLIDHFQGSQLRIYSQEMFVQGMLCRRDPFSAPDDVLTAFRAGHDGLEFVSQGWKGWVKTVVPPNRRGGGNGTNVDGWHEMSPLAAMGYKVGRNGISAFDRHEILARAFEGELLQVGTRRYMSEWGRPSSAARLQKMANHIASLCRTRRSKQQLFREAIEDWEADLQWLRDTYYHGHMTFHWPDTWL